MSYPAKLAYLKFILYIPFMAVGYNLVLFGEKTWLFDSRKKQLVIHYMLR